MKQKTISKRKTTLPAKGAKDRNPSQKEKKPESAMLKENERILGQRTASGFDNKNIQRGKEISKEDSDQVNKNLAEQDKRIHDARRIPVKGYGIRSNDLAVEEFSKIETIEKIKAAGDYDYYIPDFTRAKLVKPERSGLIEVPQVRLDPYTEKSYDDQDLKYLYIKNEKSGQIQIGKLLPQSQPVISHEFVEEALYDLGDKHKDEFEIMPEHTYDDRQGYRRYWGILSKKLNTKIEGSYRIGDVVRVGAMIRNGIDEGIAIGWDIWTYAVLCQNGSIGRNKKLGSEAWKHVGPVKELQELILRNLGRVFEVGRELVSIYQGASQMDMTEEHLKKIYLGTLIRDKYFDDKYFEINPKLKHDDPQKITLVPRKKKASLWEGYNALTQEVWHSDIHFGMKSQMLRQLNDKLVVFVKTPR